MNFKTTNIKDKFVCVINSRHVFYVVQLVYGITHIFI